MDEAAARSAEPRDFDVLIIGAGPAGIAAACAAVESGAHVGVVDDNSAPGGQIWRGLTGAGDSSSHHPPSGAAAKWHARLQRANATGNLTRIFGATVISNPEPATLIAESQVETFALRFKKLILATGARERFLPFPGWTLPGVMGAGGLQALVKSGLPIRGAQVVIAGSGPLLLAVASYLKKSSARVLMIAEQAPASRVRSFAAKLISHPQKLWQAAMLRVELLGIPYRYGTWPVRAGGAEKLEWVELTDGTKTQRVACDFLACGFHLVPNTELAALVGCKLRDGCVAVDESQQQTSAANIFCAGEQIGIGGLETALIEGEIAGHTAAGNFQRAKSLFAKRNSARKFAAALEKTFTLRDELRNLATPDTIVCRCEDVTRARLAQHHDWRSAKLQTRCGMGPCQGRVCGPAVEFIFGWKAESVRPPIFPARVSSLMILPEQLRSKADSQESQERA
jgi:D-hydroxyproline dehydrogenase subunit alpha